MASRVRIPGLVTPRRGQPPANQARAGGTQPPKAVVDLGHDGLAVRHTMRPVGAHTTGQIDDAVASLDIELTDDEIQRFEGPYTARCDLQGINDDQAGLQRARVQ
jgi:hypothetical protein